MSQFFIYRNDNKNSKKIYPFFIDVQSDLVQGLNSRIVMPFSLSKETKNLNVKNLCPVFEVEDKKYILLTHQITTVPVSVLKKEVGDFSKFRNEILGAIDILLTGI